MQNDELPYSVGMATTVDNLRLACAVRRAAYSHHDPEIGEKLGQIEALDLAEGTAVLFCRDKASGDCIGTIRVQVSGFDRLLVEQSVELPDWLAQRSRAQISRLAICAGADPRVKLSLMKASYQYCLAMQVRWMVIGARSAALIRNYRSLGFRDVFEDGGWRALASGGGLPHQILAFDVPGAEAAWRSTRNRLYGFMTDKPLADLQPQAANDSQLQPLVRAA